MTYNTRYISSSHIEQLIYNMLAPSELVLARGQSLWIDAALLESPHTTKIPFESLCSQNTYNVKPSSKNLTDVASLKAFESKCKNINPALQRGWYLKPSLISANLPAVVPSPAQSGHGTPSYMAYVCMCETAFGSVLLFEPKKKIDSMLSAFVFPLSVPDCGFLFSTCQSEAMPVDFAA